MRQDLLTVYPEEGGADGRVPKRAPQYTASVSSPLLEQQVAVPGARATQHLQGPVQTTSSDACYLAATVSSQSR